MNEDGVIPINFGNINAETKHELQKYDVQNNGSGWFESPWIEEYQHSTSNSPIKYRDYYNTTISTDVDIDGYIKPFGESNGPIWNNVSIHANYITLYDKLSGISYDFNRENNSSNKFKYTIGQESRYDIKYEESRVISSPIYSTNNISNCVSFDNNKISIDFV